MRKQGDKIKKIDELIALCLEAAHYQVCFSRNVFRYKTGNTAKFSKDEKRFLFIVFDALHNLPELTKHLLKAKEEKIGKLDDFLHRLANMNMNTLQTILTESAQESLNIKRTNKIEAWSHELQNLATICKQINILLADSAQKI